MFFATNSGVVHSRKSDLRSGFRDTWRKDFSEDRSSPCIFPLLSFFRGYGIFDFFSVSAEWCRRRVLLSFKGDFLWSLRFIRHLCTCSYLQTTPSKLGSTTMNIRVSGPETGTNGLSPSRCRINMRIWYPLLVNQGFVDVVFDFMVTGLYSWSPYFSYVLSDLSVTTAGNDLSNAGANLTKG